MQCPFGSADENALARCLIRPILRGGDTGPTPDTLPSVLQGLIGQPMGVDVVKLKQFLIDNGIGETSIGGPVEQDVTRARFLVIHDTSSPEIHEASFPVNINQKEWSGNKLSNWLNSATPTHVFVNRAGESAAKANFKTIVTATKYEAGKDVPAGPARQEARNRRRGLFLHIEMIQPRRRSHPGSSYFDIPPSPGFSQAQLDRLALLFVVASVRSGHWLLPAFHASIDATSADAHDDPQDFDLESWLDSVRTLLARLI